MSSWKLYRAVVAYSDALVDLENEIADQQQPKSKSPREIAIEQNTMYMVEFCLREFTSLDVAMVWIDSTFFPTTVKETVKSKLKERMS